MLSAPWRLRSAAALLIASIALGLVFAEPASAQVAGLKAPAPAGTQWEVLAGYNTATHEGVDPYALDLWRVDAETGGTPVLAPMSGTIGYTSESCVSIRTDALNLLLCHVFIEPGLERGDPVTVGQRIGTVAPDGQAANNGVAHIHLQLNARTDGPGSTGASLPFAGEYAIEGVNFEATTEYNGHYLRRFTSTNGEVAGGAAVDAGPDRSVLPGEVVTLTATATGVNDLFWVQESGPSVVAHVNQGATYSFVAPAEPGASVKFQVIGNANGTLVFDDISISVQLPPAEPAGEQQQVASLVGGQVFHGGISMVVFSGGTTDELIAAIACPLPGLAMWASAPNGNLVQYTVGRPAFVNAAWTSLFANGLPELTPLLLRCE